MDALNVLLQCRNTLRQLIEKYIHTQGIPEPTVKLQKYYPGAKIMWGFLEQKDHENQQEFSSIEDLEICAIS